MYDRTFMYLFDSHLSLIRHTAWIKSEVTRHSGSKDNFLPASSVDYDLAANRAHQQQMHYRPKAEVKKHFDVTKSPPAS